MKKVLAIVLTCLLLMPLIAATGAAAGSDEIVDGRFVETKKITVEVYDRGLDGGKTTPENNFYTDYIKEGMLRDHNVEVTFIPVDRWNETEAINNLLAAGDAPDVCVTYSYPTIQTYANMGGVLDMAPYLEEYKDLLPNLWGFLGEFNLYYDRDPESGTVWAIEAKLVNNARTNTFVREDWLAKLGLAEPTTLEEFEAMLYAFKDNAELLLGEDADKMIPLAISYDVGWRIDHLVAAFVPDDLSDKDAYVQGFDDRHLLYPGYKEAIRKVNEWYNAGLVWQDFALYGAGDTTEINLEKSGFVGAFMHNWDLPYRDGPDGIHGGMKTVVGEDAAFIAVESFPNDAGAYRKFLSNPIDRKVFFPATNKEPLASMLYLDWITDIEHKTFLQIGEEGVTHEVLADGAISIIAATNEKIINSQYNIDYTITSNGLDLGDVGLRMRSLGLGYGGVDASYILNAFNASIHEGRVFEHFSCGKIESEEGVDEMLKQKRDAFLAQAIVAKTEDFDKVFDEGMADYLTSGGQAIIDERAAAYAKYYGE
ncbi:MAG: extracellular solute-binding protein [Firmicutes bacterium]|nr:extracellular solute-binding protein [Bacillota bacterium]